MTKTTPTPESRLCRSAALPEVPQLSSVQVQFAVVIGTLLSEHWQTESAPRPVPTDQHEPDVAK